MLLIKKNLVGLILVFLINAGLILTPAWGQKIGKWMFIPWLVFFFLGGLLVWLTLKRKIKGKLKKYLLLTGGGALGFFGFAVLHNFFYALAVLSENLNVLKLLFEFLHGTAFIVSTLVCPLGFLVGVIASFRVWPRTKD